MVFDVSPWKASTVEQTGRKKSNNEVDQEREREKEDSIAPWVNLTCSHRDTLGSSRSKEKNGTTPGLICKRCFDWSWNRCRAWIRWGLKSGRKGDGGGWKSSRNTVCRWHGVITRQSHFSQNCESFIRHNDPRPTTSHATYEPWLSLLSLQLSLNITPRETNYFKFLSPSGDTLYMPGFFNSNTFQLGGEKYFLGHSKCKENRFPRASRPRCC